MLRCRGNLCRRVCSMRALHANRRCFKAKMIIVHAGSGYGRLTEHLEALERRKDVFDTVLNGKVLETQRREFRRGFD